MNVGLIARCDDRGIAWQTFEFFRHMKPDKTLLVLLNDPLFPEDVGRFRGDHIYPMTPRPGGKLRHWAFDEKQARKFLDGLDVVFAVETVYDWNFIEWAREMGVRTVIQGNPEFYRHHHDASLPHPDQWVWPTDWLQGELEPLLPHAFVELPVPCVERPVTAADPDDLILRVLHVAGHAAAGDRNGTLDFVEAIPSIRARCEVTIIGQDGWLPDIRKVPSNVSLNMQPHGVKDRWDLYRNQHLVVLPRRYGGLCLPVGEAMACGCAVLMPDCSPNRTWPVSLVRSRRGIVHRTPFGPITTSAVHPLELAQAVDRFAKPDVRREHMEASKSWADRNLWVDLAPMLYEPILKGAA